MSGDRLASVVVVGAGAAGLTAAIFAARAGTRPILLETRPVPGAKIRVSGGGRCNVLPSAADLDDFDTGGSRNTLRNILRSWPLEEVRAFFEKELQIPLKVEPNGKVFPRSDRAQDVVAALLGECGRTGVDLRGGSRVERVERNALESGDSSLFRVQLASGGEPIECRRLVLATGGLSLPRTGSNGHGLEIARSLGHSVRAVHPALVPLIARDSSWGELAGISLPARLRVLSDGRVVEEREGDFLFTHKGFSGPVVLDVSRLFTRPGAEGVRLEASWGAQDANVWDALLRTQGKRNVAALLGQALPRRLADRLIAQCGVPPERTTSELRRDERERLVKALTACPLEVSLSEGYRTAEVTAGGIPLEEVNPRTLESKLVPGLHFSGEMLDAVGRIGGYNFLWAWVTGRLAGTACAQAT